MAKIYLKDNYNVEMEMCIAKMRFDPATNTYVGRTYTYANITYRIVCNPTTREITIEVSSFNNELPQKDTRESYIEKVVFEGSYMFGSQLLITDELAELINRGAIVCR